MSHRFSLVVYIWRFIPTKSIDIVDISGILANICCMVTRIYQRRIGRDVQMPKMLRYRSLPMFF